MATLDMSKHRLGCCASQSQVVLEYRRCWQPKWFDVDPMMQRKIAENHEHWYIEGGEKTGPGMRSIPARSKVA